MTDVSVTDCRRCTVPTSLTDNELWSEDSSGCTMRKLCGPRPELEPARAHQSLRPCHHPPPPHPLPTRRAQVCADSGGGAVAVEGPHVPHVRDSVVFDSSASVDNEGGGGGLMACLCYQY